MKNEDEVQDRIRYLVTQELDRRVAEASRRLPHKCVNNYRHPLDGRKQIEGEPNAAYNRLALGHLPVLQTLGLCMLGASSPEEWNGTICEDPIDAQKCPTFEMKDTKESIWVDFHSQIKDLVWVQQNMPEVYGLLWALGSEKIPGLPWWKRLVFKVLRIRPDPLVNTTPILPA
jgi:hypothetical protein